MIDDDSFCNDLLALMAAAKGSAALAGMLLLVRDNNLSDEIHRAAFKIAIASELRLLEFRRSSCNLALLIFYYNICQAVHNLFC